MPRDRAVTLPAERLGAGMKELLTCANCGDCAVKLGFGFIFPGTYICAQRGDEVVVPRRREDDPHQPTNCLHGWARYKAL